MLDIEKEQYIRNTLSKSDLKEFLDSFSDSKKIIISYSGGIDSGVLLHLLFQLEKI